MSHIHADTCKHVKRACALKIFRAISSLIGRKENVGFFSPAIIERFLCKSTTREGSPRSLDSSFFIPFTRIHAWQATITRTDSFYDLAQFFFCWFYSVCFETGFKTQQGARRAYVFSILVFFIFFKIIIAFFFSQFTVFLRMRLSGSEQSECLFSPDIYLNIFTWSFQRGTRMYSWQMTGSKRTVAPSTASSYHLIL